MSVDLIVACRTNPSKIASLECPVALIEPGPAQTVRAWRPKARTTLLMRERDVAGVITLRCWSPSLTELATDYAVLVARAFDGVVVIDGEVLESQVHTPITAAELTAGWQDLDVQVAALVASRSATAARRSGASAR